MARLFLDAVPLLDVRAPVEYARGALPTATNLPLLDDRQRHEVGLAYRQGGTAAATRLGHHLISGELRGKRLEAWAGWHRDHPDGVLYCARGGQRSAIVQTWLADIGCVIPRVRGGYKALRQFLLAQLAELPPSFDWVVVGGKTGSGKTDLIRCWPAALDLEQLARHRGSAFGGLLEQQPAPVDFDNHIAIHLLRHAAEPPPGPLLVEDESVMIGRLRIAEPVFAQMQSADLVVVQAPLEERVERIHRDYIQGQFLDLLIATATEEAAHALFAQRLLAALDRIRNRLGGAAHATLRQTMARALQTRDDNLHRQWIRQLLATYYDRMYEHQLQRKTARIRFRGPMDAVHDWLRQRSRPR